MSHLSTCDHSSWRKWNVIFLFFFLIHGDLVIGQIQNDFINQNISRQQLRKYLSLNTTLFHSAVQPYEFLDSTIQQWDDSLFLENGMDLALHKKNEKFHLHVEPLFGTSILSVKNIGNNILFPHITRISNIHYRAGVAFNSSYKKKIHLRGSLFAGYAKNKIPYPSPNFLKPVQGEGLERISSGQNILLNYNAALTYTPNDIFAFQVGRGKHKFGDGYQSLLLSSRPINYPYAKIRTRVWNIEYINLYSALRSHIFEGYLPIKSNAFKKKFTSSHLLSWNVNPKVNIYFFETIIWQHDDSLSQRGFDLNYLNPIIFYRPVEYAVGSADNAIVGAGGSWKVDKKTQLYGQFIVDEMVFNQFINHTGWWANKYGIQLGFKMFDPLKIKDAYFQMEWNQVRPFTYSHGSPIQNYAHYYQALAHPAGSNFYDIMMLFVKDIQRFQLQFRSTYLLKGNDQYGSDGYQNLGSNIFASYVNPYINYGNVVGQGITTHDYTNDLNLAYVFNRKSDGRIFFNVIHHNLYNPRSHRSLWMFYAGLSMNFIAD